MRWVEFQSTRPFMPTSSFNVVANSGLTPASIQCAFIPRKTTIPWIHLCRSKLLWHEIELVISCIQKYYRQLHHFRMLTGIHWLISMGLVTRVTSLKWIWMKCGFRIFIILTYNYLFLGEISSRTVCLLYLLCFESLNSRCSVFATLTKQLFLKISHTVFIKKMKKNLKCSNWCFESILFIKRNINVGFFE